MTRPSSKEAELSQRISEILWKVWDPIGVYSANSEHPDEYDSYVPYIARLVAEGADERKISGTLEGLLRDNMGGSNGVKCPKEKHIFAAQMILLAKEDIYG